MANESFQRAIKIISQRRQNAIIENENRKQVICEKIPRIKEIYRLLTQTGVRLSKSIFIEHIDSKTIIEQLKNENLTLQKELCELLVMNRYPFDYLNLSFQCNACLDTGYVNGMKCSCLKQLISKINVNNLNQTIDMQSMRFDNFHLEYYSDVKCDKAASPREQMGDILEYCEGYAQNFRKNAPNILMMGETGLGKTHLSLSIANCIVNKGFTTLYISSLDLFRTLQNEYYGRGSDKNTMQSVFEADLVIIDDLGAEFDNQFHISSLYNIINTRLNSGKPTLINTNFTPAELEKRYSSRIASRLMTMYQCLKFMGKDVRQVKLQLSV